MRRNEFIEVTNLRGELILLNPDHIIGIGSCDYGTQITFNCTVTMPCECDQRNYMLIRESYAWMKYELTGKFTDGDEPERYMEKYKS